MSNSQLVLDILVVPSNLDQFREFLNSQGVILELKMAHSHEVGCSGTLELFSLYSIHFNVLERDEDVFPFLILAYLLKDFEVESIFKCLKLLFLIFTI